jgi:hypothetical protein
MPKKKETKKEKEEVIIKPAPVVEEGNGRNNGR